MVAKITGYLAGELAGGFLDEGIEIWLSEAAGFNSVDSRIVLLPLVTKSISSLCPRSSPTCPTPNEAYSTQLCRSQFIKVRFPGATFTHFP
jgi:hypothetical protein